MYVNCCDVKKLNYYLLFCNHILWLGQHLNNSAPSLQTANYATAINCD